MSEKVELKVKGKHVISDGNGGSLVAIVDNVERYWITYRTRAGNKGRYGLSQQQASPAKFRRLIREAA